MVVDVWLYKSTWLILCNGLYMIIWINKKGNEMLTKNKQRKKNREIIYRNNKPVSVIIDIDEYEKLLERLEDIEDVEFIRNLKKEKLEFRSLDTCDWET